MKKKEQKKSSDPKRNDSRNDIFSLLAAEGCQKKDTSVTDPSDSI